MREDQNLSARPSLQSAQMQETLLSTVLIKVDEVGSSMYNNLNEIEAKLNNIIEHPSNPNKDGGVQPIEVDFSQKIHRALQFLSAQLSRLESVREHINEIV